MPGTQNPARHRRNQGLALHEMPPHPRPSRDATSNTRGRRGPHSGGSLRARGLGELVGAPQRQGPATNPRFPAHCSVGNRSSRLPIPPQCLREWAMVPTALKLGLKAPGTNGCRIPDRASAAEKGLHTLSGAPATLAENEVYIGPGHFSTRLKTTKWASPFIVGQDGSAQRCVARYIDHARATGLLDDILELEGKTLVCDCPKGMLCTGDALALEVYARISGKTIVEIGNLTFCHEAGAWGSQNRQREVIPAAGTGQGAQIPPPMKISRPQHGVVTAFKSLFPSNFFKNLQFPAIEDLVSSFPFTAFMEWQAARGLDPDGAAGPPLLQGAASCIARGGMGEQQGAVSDEDGPTTVGVVPTFPRRPLQEGPRRLEETDAS